MKTKKYSALRIEFSHIFFLILGIGSTPAWAEPTKALPDIGMMLVSLLLIIGLILGLASLMKRFNLAMPGQQGMKIISTLPLGAKEKIIVIEVQGKQHALGITGQNINYLFPIEEPLEKPEPKEFKKAFDLEQLLGKRP
ncbi:flagellar biosynthetic protein FliO [Algicola sagamiensis]|uniref:flagellar biosynthetic protein FliO n=1 Tax=Algicola sagamiensis TaxID=163869 RepID=UPI0003776151|nr:flagellar biosynthetic protein FliO [Algicola sagamiensis]